MNKINSKKFPDISYIPGDEIFYDPEESGMKFYFEIEEALTESKEAMETVGAFLDDVDGLAEKASVYLKSVLSDIKNPDGETVKNFLEFHKGELEEDIIDEIFGVDDPKKLTLELMIDYLKVDRFGSLEYGNRNEQVFVLDLSFDPEFTQELLVVYFDLDKNIFSIAHES